MSSTYQRIRCLWPDHFGLARGKYLPGDFAHHGSYHSMALFALGYDRQMTPAPGSMMLEGLPDLHARFSMDDVRPGWEPRTGVAVADIFFRDAPVPISPRHALHRAVADWRELGYEPKVGIELEAYVFEPDDAGGWRPWHTPGGYVYGTGPAVDPTGLLDDIMDTAEAAELPLESVNSEYDIPQFELTLRYDDAVRAVDDAFLFKVLAREVATRHGLLLTFLGKPLSDRGGSGLHVNISFDDGAGHNALLDDAADDGLSKLARCCVAGLMCHHAGMTAVCAPTVNAYKRLRPGQLSGYWTNWGYDHRGATVRVSPERNRSTRLEHRMADGAANPYTATAAVLQAARLGFVGELDCPAPETSDALETADAEDHCPHSLPEALDALEADAAFADALGSELVDHFVVIKRAEYDRFAATTTDWELNEYLPFH